MRAMMLHLSLMLLLAGGWPGALSAANPAPPAEPVSVQRDGILYVTRAGDTLSSIAKQFTTRQDHWQVLGRLNSIDKDTALAIGTRIRIPADLLQDEPSEAALIALSGSIVASSAQGQSVLLGIGSRITEGMQITTGNNSFLTMLLPDQSRISVPSNSHIRIAKLRTTLYTRSPRTEILLLNGRIESKISPLEQNKGRFEVRTPLAVAGVRGTDFRVAVGNNGTATAVVSGKVEVGRPSQRGNLLLGAGEGNLTDAKAVGKPVKLLPAPQLAGRPAPLHPAGARFRLTPVPGAARYHVQVATDQQAQAILMERYASEPQLQFDGLAAGSYFARISAIDKQGLEGLASIRAFALDAAPAALADPEVPDALQAGASQTGQLVLRWNAAAGRTFNVQVGRDPAFSWLLYSATSTAPEVHFARPAFGTYYARVQAIKPDGTTGPYSPAQPFVVTDQWIIQDGNPASVSGSLPRPLR